MIQLEFTVTVEANGPGDEAYLKHLIKGALRNYAPHAKVSCYQSIDTSFFEEIEKQEVESGRLDL